MPTVDSHNIAVICHILSANMIKQGKIPVYSAIKETSSISPISKQNSFLVFLYEIGLVFAKKWAKRGIASDKQLLLFPQCFQFCSKRSLSFKYIHGYHMF